MEVLKALIGIVACGGKSERMGVDKSCMVYHSKEQRYHLYDMMKTSCKDVFLSCNTEQIKGIDEAYKILEDDPQYLEMGPLTALLSAHKNHPDASLLLLGCDYPLINSEHLLLLQKNRSINMEAVCFVNASDRFPEPLLAIYENKFLKKIAQNYQLYNASLREMLSKAKIKSIAEDSLQLMSVDTPEDFFEMKKRLGNK